MKTKVKVAFTVFVLFGVLIGLIAFIVYVLTLIFNDFRQFFTEPGLSQRLDETFRQLLISVEGLALCCVGIIIFVFLGGFIMSKIPPSWIGRREATDDDYWYDDL